MTTLPPVDPAKLALLEAALPHVAFDGWSRTVFEAAAQDAGMDHAAARALCPRGAVDLAILYHHEGDRAMCATIAAADLGGMRFRDKVAFAIRARLSAAEDKEVVRRGTALFALPIHAPEGAKLIWGTADHIWRALGDTSEDINWYTKRVTLSGVYASCVIYWLGDTSAEGEATDAFIDRRIEDVMQFEAAKARVNNSKFLQPFLGPLNRFAAAVRAPGQGVDQDVPGRWEGPQ